ncbi:MAG TPA: PsbP-related protein [Gaiellaceae bacterium]|nr:PsbP-related protein [Gaiellaceae bacterium]
MRWFGPLLLLPVLLAACGGGGKASSSTTTTVTTAPAALQGDATSAATGDIPDNQVFLAFHDTRAGYALKYPEGWAQRGGGDLVTFRDKNNIIRVSVLNASAPTAATVSQEIHNLAGVVNVAHPTTLQLAGGTAYRVTYQTRSAPNAVTGKRVTLIVDRYVLSHAGKIAVLDLGTPVGVDNVDAYRLIAHSFQWR